MTNEVFDFGFTAVDEQDLDGVVAKEDEVKQLNDKLDALYGAVIPLLDNLKKNPDKDYILWPDRVAKVEAFEKKLKDILRS
jgi:hypothetical protein